MPGTKVVVALVSGIVVFGTVFRYTTKTGLLASWKVQGWLGAVGGNFVSLLRTRFPILATLIPPGPADTVYSPTWLTKVFAKAGLLSQSEVVVSATLTELKGNRGLVGQVNRLKVVLRNKNGVSKNTSFIVKSTKGNSRSRSLAIASGLCREAKFYRSRWSKVPELERVLPVTYHASWSNSFGSFVLLQQDLSTTHQGANLFLGNQIWGIDPDIGETTEATKVTLVKRIVELSRMVHQCTWNTVSDAEPWLKSAPWMKGRDRARWETFKGYAQSRWKLAKQMMDGVHNLNLSPKLVRSIERYLESNTFNNVSEWLNQNAKVLAHGDFHAANILVDAEKDTQTISDSKTQQSYRINGLKLLDWSEVGPWVPGTEVGQMFISDVSPELRRKLVGGKHSVDNIVRTHYWEPLIKSGTVSEEEYSWDMCWDNFVFGSLSRWYGMFVILASFGLPPQAIQFFHDQLNAFLVDYVEDTDAVVPMQQLVGLIP